MLNAEIAVPRGWRRVRHLTPQYMLSRGRQLLYERGHPGEPWLTPAAIRLLATLLRPCDHGLEFGSGRSTAWLAGRVAQLISVEHDAAWFDKVHADLERRRLTNVRYVLAALDQPEERADRSDYLRPLLGLAAGSLDFVLVDGAYRDHAARLVLPRIKPGGLLIIDNVNWFLPSASRAPNSRSLAAGPNGPVWAEVAAELSCWRSIWTSSGVWDTALFVRP